MTAKTKPRSDGIFVKPWREHLKELTVRPFHPFLFKRATSSAECLSQLENWTVKKRPHTCCRGRKGLPVLPRKSQHMVVKAVAWTPKTFLLVMPSTQHTSRLKRHRLYDGHSYLSMSKKKSQTIRSPSSLFSLFLLRLPSTWPWNIRNRGSFSIISCSFKPKSWTRRPVQTVRPSAKMTILSTWGLECHDFSHLRNHLLIIKTQEERYHPGY